MSLLAAGTAAAGCGAAVVGAKRSKEKRREENESLKEVEKLGKEFMKLVEPLKNDLQEIKTTCEKLEERSTEVQAENTLSELEELKMILRRVSELGKMIGEGVIAVVTVFEMIDNLLTLFVIIIRFTATPEEDKKFRESIIQSGDQCQKVVDKFNMMKEKLSEFRGK